MKLRQIIQESVISSFADQLKSKYQIQTLFLSTDKNDIILSSIIIGKENQGTGIGTKVMIELCDYADKNKQRIRLTPGLYDKKYGTTSQSRLIDFYKRFGFIMNKGRNKDYSISELMYRDPK